MRAVIVAMVLMILVNAGVALALYEATRSVNRQSYERCLDRQVNTNKLNDFAHEQSAIDATDPSLDARTRTLRVRSYQHLVLAAPRCGHP